MEAKRAPGLYCIGEAVGCDRPSRRLQFPMGFCSVYAAAQHV